MAKFDVYRTADGTTLVDCQSELLAHLSTRFMAPLAFPDDAVAIDRRLTPLLEVAGHEMLMLTHFAAAVPVSALGRRISTVRDQDYVVANALDMLISGC